MNTRIVTETGKYIRKEETGPAVDILSPESQVGVPIRRRLLFLSHATRQENAFAKWLATQLAIRVRGLVRCHRPCMFLDEPHTTTKNYKSLRAKVGTDIFARQHKLEPYYVAAFAAYKLELQYRSLKIGADYKSARYHIFARSACMLSNSRH
jgi:hypothetical protein